MNVTYYLDVISSWCYWAEPAWRELKASYAAAGVQFEWKIALMDKSGMPSSHAQLEWFYRRSGTIVRSPFMLNSGWFDQGMEECLAPNLVAEAARDFGIADDRVRLALMEAGMREGLKVGNWEVAVAVGAKAARVDESVLLAKAKAPEIEKRVRAATAEFHAMKATQRPTFVLTNAIGDRAVFVGLVKARPMAAAIEAMLDDAAAYAAHKAHFGAPPS